MPSENRVTADLKEYGLELHTKMAEAWELARQNICGAQKRQKTAYDRKSRELPFREGERVFLYKPAEKTGEARKFARPFHGPYRVLEMGTNTAKICRVDRPEEEPLLVSLDRLRRCPEEIGEGFWPPDARGSMKKKKKLPPDIAPSDEQPAATPDSNGFSKPESQSRGRRNAAAPRQQNLNSTSMVEEKMVTDSGRMIECTKSGVLAKDEASESHCQEQAMGDREGQRPLINRWAGRLRRRQKSVAEEGSSQQGEM